MTRDDETGGPLGKAVLLPVWDKPEPYFKVLDKLSSIVPSHKSPWRIKPDDNRVKTHELASTRECLVAVHPNAIAIGSPYGQDRKSGGWVVMGLMLALALFCLFFVSMVARSEEPNYFLIWIGSLSAALSALIWIWAFSFTVRTPSDWPILFNKKDRTVTFVRPTRPRFLKFWGFTKPGACTYSWDEAKVRSYKLVVSNAGRSFHESYWLVLLWGMKDEHGRNVVKDCVPIGYEGYFEDERLFQVWEHIRRYMEEDGPPIQPGERLRKPANNRKPMEFPPQVIAAAGGPAFSVAEVERLADVGAEVRE